MLKPNGRYYQTTEELVYKDIIVPEGYLTDGISYKLRIVSLFVNKFDPRFIIPTIVHDYLCDLEEYEKADRYFEELLPKNWRKPLMVNSVKIYHKIRYGV